MYPLFYPFNNGVKKEKVNWKIEGYMDQALGRFLKLVRLEMGDSQEEFSAKINLSYKFYGELERGEKIASSHSFYFISKGLNISSDRIYHEVSKIYEHLKDEQNE